MAEDLMDEGYIISFITSTQTQILSVCLSIVLHLLSLWEGDCNPIKSTSGVGAVVILVEYLLCQWADVNSMIMEKGHSGSDCK